MHESAAKRAFLRTAATLISLQNFFSAAAALQREIYCCRGTAAKNLLLQRHRSEKFVAAEAPQRKIYCCRGPTKKLFLRYKFYINNPFDFLEFIYQFAEY